LKFIKKLAAFAAFAFLAATAHAEIITFRFTGTVTYSTYLAPVGTQITGVFTYDTKSSPTIDPKSQHAGVVGYRAYRSDIPVTAQVNGHTISSQFLTVDVFNNLGGNAEDMVWINGPYVTVDGTYFANGSLGLALASAYGHKTALPNANLPTSYDVSQFDAPGLTYGYLQMDGSQTGTLLQFTVDSIDVTSVQP
jgi:hypothetical protein